MAALLTWRAPEFDDPARLRKYARDMVADPYFSWLSDYRSMVGIQLALAVVLYAWGGAAFVLWGIFVRLAVVYHVTWLVNSAAHCFGYRNHATSDRSTNCWWVSLLAFGEGWHNNHHAAPDYAHVQHQWWEFDALWQVTRLLEATGQVWGVKRPPASLLPARTPAPGADTRAS